MNFVARNFAVASVLATVATFAHGASALPISPIETSDDFSTIDSAKTVNTVKAVTLKKQFLAPEAATRASLMQGAVTPAESQGAEQIIDVGDLDEAEEAHTEYGVIKRTLPAAKGGFTPISSSDVISEPEAASLKSSRAASFVPGEVIKLDPILIPGKVLGCGGTPVATYSKTWDHGSDFGNSKFGAGYQAAFTLASTASATPNMDKISGEAMARAYATIFGSSRDLARVTGKASLQGSTGSASISVRAVGTDLYSKSVTGNLTESKQFNKTFFSASQLIWLGPVPVTFKATANGVLGYNYSATYVAPAINLAAKPYAKAYATATAAIDVVLASAGVTGTLTLLELAVPATAKLTIQPTWVNYDVDVDFVLKSLSGKIEGWAKVYYLFGSKKWTTKLASWNGVAATYPLIDTAGCILLKF